MQKAWHIIPPPSQRDQDLAVEWPGFPAAFSDFGDRIPGVCGRIFRFRGRLFKFRG